MRKGKENTKRKERKEKEKRSGKEVQHLLVSSIQTRKRFDGLGNELNCAPRGKGSLLFWLVLV